jgi:polyhydroxybutyrate depolymerase
MSLRHASGVMRPPALVALALAGFCAGGCGGTGSPIEPAAQPKPTIEVRTLNVQGGDRTYRVVRPPASGVSKALPLLLVLHGAGSTAEEVAVMTGFDTVSVQERVIVAYPNADNGRWHASGSGNVDDVLFIRTLIDRLEADYQIDPARIYATGFSNGGEMTYRLACQLADRIAAVGPVAGTNGTADCHPAHPISVIAFHGTTDSNSRYEGDPGIGVLSFPAEFERWQQLNGCTGSPKVEDSSTLVIRSAANCLAGTAVIYYTLVEGDHEWPRSATVSATKLIWQFFAAKSRA